MNDVLLSIFDEISLLILSIALKTDFPRYALGSLSLNSKASRVPVDAPEGTAPRPMTSESRIISASHVGFPRESIICRPMIFLILMLTSLSDSVIYIYNIFQ